MLVFTKIRVFYIPFELKRMLINLQSIYPLARGSTACVNLSGSARFPHAGRARMIDTRGRTAREQG